VRNNPAKFHPDPIWNNRMSSDMVSLPDSKITDTVTSRYQIGHEIRLYIADNPYDKQEVTVTHKRLYTTWAINGFWFHFHDNSGDL